MSIAQLLTTASIMKGQMESQHYLRFRRFGPNFFGPMGDLGASPEEVAPFFCAFAAHILLFFISPRTIFPVQSTWQRIYSPTMDRGLYRILDANFNRAREACRVMEEYCRFVMEVPGFSARAKTIRHRLCSAIKDFDTLALLSSRDSQTDVGRNLRVEGQLKRGDLKDVFIAASKRASEAFRALAEAGQVLSPDTAMVFEELRFEIYTLEKDVVIAAQTKSRFKNVQLYVLIGADRQSDKEEVLALTRACCSGGADCLQLRAKGLQGRPLLELAAGFVRICRDHNVLSIINDRVDIAVLTNADGVHLGQTDIPINDARRLSPKPMIFGVSTHSTNELKAAIDEDADYIALGPAFATRTKPHLNIAGCDYIRKALKILDGTDIPHVAIGGIDATNLDQVLAAGAVSIAVCSVVSLAKDPQKACTQLKASISSFARK